MPSITMVEAAISWAKKNMPGAEGFNSGECACTFDNPAPCGQFTADCEVAFRGDCSSCESHGDDGCGSGWDFCMNTIDVGDKQ